MNNSMLTSSTRCKKGMFLPALAMRAIADVLFGVTPLDAVAFSVAPLLLVVVAFAACLLPAWRAATILPYVLNTVSSRPRSGACVASHSNAWPRNG